MTEETKGAKNSGSRSRRSSMSPYYDAATDSVHFGSLLAPACTHLRKSQLEPNSRLRPESLIGWIWNADAEFELAAADLRRGVAAAGRQPQRAGRRCDGLARGDRAEPLRQDRLHHQPDPQS